MRDATPVEKQLIEQCFILSNFLFLFKTAQSQIVLRVYRTRGIPSHLLGAQPNGRQEQQQPLNDNEHNSSDTSVEDSKIQFQNNLRKFKAKCDNELEKLLEKCESRRKTNLDRKYFGSESASSSSRLMIGDLGARNVRRFDSANNNFNANKDDDENGTWIAAAYESDYGLLIWADDEQLLFIDIIISPLQPFVLAVMFK